MRAGRGFVLGCAVLVLLTCFAAEAKDKPGTVGVNCDRGGSINQALEYNADPLIIEVNGACHEDVVIERSNVTLRGGLLGGAVVAASSTAIFLDRVSRVSIENLTVQGGIEGPGETGGAGIIVWFSTAVSVSNLVVENDQGKGMTVVGSEVLISDSDFQDNHGYGLQGNQSNLFFLGEVNFINNRFEGLLLSFQTRLTSLAVIRAYDNGEHGIALGQHSSATLGVQVLAYQNNSAGIIVDQGSILVMGDAQASLNENGMMAMNGGQIHIDEHCYAIVQGNTDSGLTATNGGFFNFRGVVNSNGTDGVYLHGSSATIHDSNIYRNTSSDVVLLFGSTVDFEGTNTVDDVVCDGTVLVEGDVNCVPNLEGEWTVVIEEMCIPDGYGGPGEGILEITTQTGGVFAGNIGEPGNWYPISGAIAGRQVRISDVDYQDELIDEMVIFTGELIGLHRMVGTFFNWDIDEGEGSCTGHFEAVRDPLPSP